jgi:hypothetical protein
MEGAWNIRPQWASDKVRDNGIAIGRSADPHQVVGYLRRDRVSVPPVTNEFDGR